ncbi:MAG: hypothetical protein RSC56_01580 [Acidaminococcaceae bacterium]
MKKILSCLMLAVFLCTTLIAEAASSNEPKGRVNPSYINNHPTPMVRQQRLPQGKKPVVAVLYINNALTSYDGELDGLILENLKQAIPSGKYVYVDGSKYVRTLQQAGIVDLATAERADFMDAFSGEVLDYVVFVELQPLMIKNKATVFTVGKDVISLVPLKIIDVQRDRYLYNGKLTDKTSVSNIIMGVGNKSVVVESLTKINQQLTTIISQRLPLTKAASSSELVKKKG